MAGLEASAAKKATRVRGQICPPLMPASSRRPPCPAGAPKGPAFSASDGTEGLKHSGRAAWRPLRRTSSASKLQPLPTGLSRGTPLPDPRTAEEVFRTGPWSVRRLQEPSILIYVHTEEQRVQMEPPEEVLQALQLGPDGVCGVESSTLGAKGVPGGLEQPMKDEATPQIQQRSRSQSSAIRCSKDLDSCAKDSDKASDGTSSPRFRRIVLGARCETPLKMARDILEVLQEDPTMFSQVQQHFSDVPDESILGLGGGISDEVEEAVLQLQPGQLSEVMGIEDGMQILLRVS